MRDEDGTIRSPMRDATPDNVPPGGRAAPLGARGRSPDGGIAATEADVDRGTGLPFADGPRVLASVLVLALVSYAAIAADVAAGGGLSAHDQGLSEWVARSMPGWVEWIA